MFGLAGAILSWEALPVDSRPSHPMALLWTDNMMGAHAETKKIEGINALQSQALARILAYLLQSLPEMLVLMASSKNYSETLRNICKSTSAIRTYLV
jgi:hypothetical protein